MRRLNSAEKGALVPGGVLILGGAFAVLHPSAMNIFHKANRLGGAWTEHMSANEDRFIGGCAILMGAGIVGGRVRERLERVVKIIRGVWHCRMLQLVPEKGSKRGQFLI